MKYIFSFLTALVFGYGLPYLGIPEFLVGWFSCMGWYVTLLYFEYKKESE